MNVQILTQINKDIVNRIHKDIIQELYTLNKLGRNDIIKEFTNLRDAIIGNKKDELDIIDELENTMDEIEGSISSLKTRVKSMGTSFSGAWTQPGQTQPGQGCNPDRTQPGHGHNPDTDRQCI